MSAPLASFGVGSRHASTHQPVPLASVKTPFHAGSPWEWSAWNCTDWTILKQCPGSGLKAPTACSKGCGVGPRRQSARRCVAGGGVVRRYGPRVRRMFQKDR